MLKFLSIKTLSFKKKNTGLMYKIAVFINYCLIIFPSTSRYSQNSALVLGSPEWWAGTRSNFSLPLQGGFAEEEKTPFKSNIQNFPHFSWIQNKTKQQKQPYKLNLTLCSGGTNQIYTWPDILNPKTIIP